MVGQWLDQEQDGQDSQKHQHPCYEDEEATKIGNTPAGTYCPPSVRFSVSSWIGVVQKIV